MGPRKDREVPSMSPRRAVAAAASTGAMAALWFDAGLAAVTLTFVVRGAKW